MIEIIFFILLGSIIGTFTGLMPGIHINLVAAFIVATPLILEKFSSSGLVAFIISLAITHTFLDFLPSIFLGAPNEETALSLLPGHKFLLEGKGYEASILTLIGSVSAVVIFLLITPLIILFLPKIYPYAGKIMGILLIWASLILFVCYSKSKNKSLIIFLLAGFLGIININSSVNQPLLPLLSGLFGAPSLIAAIKSKTNIPPQKIEKINFDKKKLIRPLLITGVISPICSILPGVGSSHAAAVGSKISGEINESQFLILLGSIGTLVMATSFVALISINKARSGAASAISQIGATNLSITLIFTSIIVSSILASIIFINISKIFATKISKINYSKVSLIVLLFLSVIVFAMSGFIGEIFFFVSASVGLLCTEMGVSKQFLMGSLLIPSIIFFI